MVTPKERIADMLTKHPERAPLIEEARRKLQNGGVRYEVEKAYIFPTDPEIQHCPKCGIVLEKVMMYSCPNSNCPTGLGSHVIF